MKIRTAVITPCSWEILKEWYVLVAVRVWVSCYGVWLVGWLGLFGSGFFCLICYFCLCLLLFLFQLFVALVSVFPFSPFIAELNEHFHGL